MKKFAQNVLRTKNDIKKFLIIVIILLTIAALGVYNLTNYITIRFDELGPLTKNMSAYYNGFKIGKIVRLDPDTDFKHILVRVNLNQKNINLPQNTVVFVERFPNGELYLQFVYPKSPSLVTLKRGDVLEGVAPYNLEQFMMGQSVSGMSDLVSLHIIKALNATDAANHEMQEFFKVTSKIIKDNGRGINASVNNTAAMTKSFAQMAENLNQASKKLNNAVDEAVLKDTTLNLKDTTSSVKEAADNISKATKDIDKTIKKIDDTISKANSTAENLNSMTNGLNGTLSQRFAGMKLLFGTPLKPKK